MKWIKNNWFPLIIIFLVILYINLNKTAERVVTDYKEIEDITKVEYFRNQLNQEIARSKQLELSSNKQLKDIAKKYSDSLGSIKSELNKRTKELTIISREIKSKGGGKVVYVEKNGKPDTITRYIDHKDEYVELQASVGKENYEFDLKIKDTIEITKEKFRSKFLGPKETRLNVLSKNPYSSTKDIKSIVIKEKQKRLVVGPSAGVTYNSGKITPYVGVGITFKLFEF